MVLEKFTYFVDGKKKTIDVKKVSIFSPGLLFRRKSPPLLFTLRKEKSFSIFSLFCKPFKAIWIDEKKRTTKIVDVKNWKLNIRGHGKYLLEIPTRITQK
ncbi:hypothetical protein HOA55_02540 [archaeon]|jgi:uncharacterized membrane protein (UPF0127 family)|nr:hypothetical protein [archaeon]